MMKADILLAEYVLFFYDKFKGNPTYFCSQKTNINGEYYISFDSTIINVGRYRRKIKSKTTLVKEAFHNKKLFISAYSTEI
jgi:hypothetical protein